MINIQLFNHDQAVAFVESGCTAGFPILIQHGMIASINDQQLFARLAKTGARLVSIARPGYGRSSPYEMKNVGEWGEIIGMLADRLGLAQFDVFGISSGAPYAYAIGGKLPGRVRNIFILSGIPALCEDAVAARWPFPVNRGANIAEMQTLAREIFFPNSSPADLERDDIKDSMEYDCFGPALDLKIRGMDWGFPFSAIQAPVFMRHSRTDNIACAELTAQLLPHCRLEIREHDDHFSQPVLDDFITTVMVPHYTK